MRQAYAPSRRFGFYNSGVVRRRKSTLDSISLAVRGRHAAINARSSPWPTPHASSFR
jgi:hypothetical protein